MKKLQVLLVIAILLPIHVHATKIVQHADASNGHIPVEEVLASGPRHKWYVFHFATPFAIRTQVQSWVNGRRDYYRANANDWALEFRWYVTGHL